MSYEFIQEKYHKDEKEEDLYFFNTYNKELAMKNGVVLLVPKLGEGVPYNKALVECAVNLLFQCSQSLSKTIDYHKSSVISEEDWTKRNITNHKVDLDMTYQVQEIGALLQWIVNSTSWRSGKYLDFDKFEIERKLEYIKVYSRRKTE